MKAAFAALMVVATAVPVSARPMTANRAVAIDAAVQDDAVKAIILAGNGPHFSSGHDLRPGGKNEAGVDFPPIGNWGGFAEANAHGRFAREQEAVADDIADPDGGDSLDAVSSSGFRRALGAALMGAGDGEILRAGAGARSCPDRPAGDRPDPS